MLQRRIKSVEMESHQILIGISGLCLYLEKKIVLISSWYFSPVFTGEILVSKNDNNCFTKWMHCARGHYLQLPALLNSSLPFILICKFMIFCQVMERYAPMEIDSSS